MPRSAVLNLRIEPEVKKDAEELFGSFGLTVTDAVNIFLRQSLMRDGFPFEIVRNKPNNATQTDMLRTKSQGDVENGKIPTI